MTVQVALAQPVTMESFMKIVTQTNPKYAICVRGRHAVGKSEGVYQAAAKIFSEFYRDDSNAKKYSWVYDQGLPVIERRLSQMTEGDIIGLPFMEGEDRFDSNGKRVQYASTQFKPCDWLLQACERPVLLFLDERNRALDGVKQAVFQLADSKKFYGYELHPETKIVIAENIGDEYQVQACDPAEISRCAVVVTLEPTVEDWLKYATPRCNEATVDFIRSNQSMLEHTGPFDPNKKYADRRAWYKLDQEATRLGLFEDPSDAFFYTLAGAFLGVECGRRFVQFCSERDRQVSGKDILTDWNKAKKRLMKGGSISNEAYVECVNKLGAYMEKVLVDDEQAVEIARFMWDAPAEPRMVCYSFLQKQQKNLVRVHRLVQELIIATATGKEIPECKLPANKNSKATAPAASSETGNETAAASATGRGSRKK